MFCPVPSFFSVIVRGQLPYIAPKARISVHNLKIKRRASGDFLIYNDASQKRKNGLCLLLHVLYQHRRCCLNDMALMLAAFSTMFGSIAERQKNRISRSDPRGKAPKTDSWIAYLDIAQFVVYALFDFTTSVMGCDEQANALLTIIGLVCCR